MSTKFRRRCILLDLHDASLVSTVHFPIMHRDKMASDRFCEVAKTSRATQWGAIWNPMYQLELRLLPS
jgi:hypothetical protein